MGKSAGVFFPNIGKVELSRAKPQRRGDGKILRVETFFVWFAVPAVAFGYGETRQGASHEVCAPEGVLWSAELLMLRFLSR